MATMTSAAAMATAPALPHELRGEPRWSHYEERQPPLPWMRATDERLVALVTRSTASGERFPVGVNWLEVSRTVGHSPVECVKRYALLHESSEQPGVVATVGSAHDHSDVLDPHGESASEDVQSVPFSGLSSSDENGSPRRQSFSGFSTPLTSPKLSSLDTSDEFGVGGMGSPGSPPPFAVRTARQNSGDIAAAAAVSSSLRWEALLNESAYSSPVLRSPPHARSRGAAAPFGIDDECKFDAVATAPISDGSVMSPRIIHGTQDHTRPMLDPHYASNIINHAFKGMQIDTPPASSPRMIRTTSANGDFPFLKDDDVKRALAGAQQDASAPAFLASPRAAAPTLINEQQLQAHLMKMSAMSAMSSFHGDNPFSGSLTQSALEDAFLDMAGSRLDTSNVLLSSRFSMAQSRAPALERSSVHRHGSDTSTGVDSDTTKQSRAS